MFMVLDVGVNTFDPMGKGIQLNNTHWPEDFFLSVLARNNRTLAQEKQTQFPIN